MAVLNRSSWIVLLVAALVLALAFDGVRADAGIEDDLGQPVFDQATIQLQKQLAELESRLSLMDANLKQARQESFDKSKKIVSLESEVETLQKRATGDLQMKLESSEAKAEDSAKQVEHLKEALKKSEANVEELQKKLDSSEAKVDELTKKLSKAEKTVSTLRKKLRDAEEALKIAEGLMQKAEAEANEKAQELYKVYEGWLPPWAAGHLAQLQATSASYWSVHGEPFFRKAAEHASHHTKAAQEWANPHLTTLKTKVGPAAKDYWEKGYGTVSSKSKLAVSKVCGVYKLHISPHVETAKVHVSPYVKMVREKVGPHVDQAAVYIRPYYEQGRKYAAPHIGNVQQAFHKGTSSALHYRRLLEKSVRNQLLKHEVSAPWAASKEVVTFLTLTLAFVPCVAMLVLFSGKKEKKPVSNRSQSAHKKHRRTKQHTLDK